MIIVLKPGATQGEVDQVDGKIRSFGLSSHISRGVERTIIGAIGDERKLDAEAFPLLRTLYRIVALGAPVEFEFNSFFSKLPLGSPETVPSVKHK